MQDLRYDGDLLPSLSSYIYTGLRVSWDERSLIGFLGSNRPDVQSQHPGAGPIMVGGGGPPPPGIPPGHGPPPGQGQMVYK